MDDIENLGIKIPKLTEPKTIAELNQQLSDIEDCMGKLETMLTHLAASNFDGHYSTDLDLYMSEHLKLTSQKNQLLKKKEQMEMS